MLELKYPNLVPHNLSRPLKLSEVQSFIQANIPPASKLNEVN